MRLKEFVDTRRDRGDDNSDKGYKYTIMNSDGKYLHVLYGENHKRFPEPKYWLDNKPEETPRNRESAKLTFDDISKRDKTLNLSIVIHPKYIETKQEKPAWFRNNTVVTIKDPGWEGPGANGEPALLTIRKDGTAWLSAPSSPYDVGPITYDLPGLTPLSTED